MTEVIGEQEPIPYSVTFEGKIMPEKLPELLDLLGRISTEQHVSYQIGEEPVPATEIHKEQFQDASRNGTAAGLGWGQLRRAAEQHEDFPLRFHQSEDRKASWFVGNVEEALGWMARNPLKGPGSGVAKETLKKFTQPKLIG